jgi:hypothetical protein
MDATLAAAIPTGPIDWIRKRDGEVVRLEPEKLTQALQRAAEDSIVSMSGESLAELTQMTLFFLSTNVTGPVATAEEIAEWVEKSLRETGHADLADSCSRYRKLKMWAHTGLAVLPDERTQQSEPVAPAFWDKSRIVQSLRVRLNLDPRRARAIASHVERCVIRGRFDRLTTSLIRELVNTELERWSVQQRLAPPGQVWISTCQLKRELSSSGGPSQASARLTRQVWHDFSLNEVVSRDVADAERRGLLSVHGLGAPASLAAACIDCCPLVRHALGSRESLVQFGSQLAQATDRCSRLLAIDGVETWLSLVAEPADTPARLAEQFWNELCSRLRYSSLQCVLNLYGGMPPGSDIELGAGPLFHQQPLSAEREFAGAVAQELLDLFRRDSADWPNLRLDWHWFTAPDPVQTALTGRIMRVMEEGHRVAIAFDREPAPLGEGLRRVRDTIRPVLDYVGISLPVVWRDAGSPRSLPALEEGLRQTVELSVRAAVQRREFVRRLPRRGEVSAVDNALASVYPIGLDWTVQQLVGKSMAEDEGALKLGETLVRYLHDSAERECRHFGLAVAIDHPTDLPERSDSADEQAAGDTRPLVAGLGAATVNLSLRRQIHAAARLHAIAQAGTLDCLDRARSLQNPQHLSELLHWTARSSELVRLRLIPQRRVHDQAIVEWPD